MVERVPPLLLTRYSCIVTGILVWVKSVRADQIYQKYWKIWYGNIIINILQISMETSSVKLKNREEAILIGRIAF